MSESKYQPIIDNAEFHKLVHSLGNIKNDFQQLIDEFKELNDRFVDLSDGEMDWWMVKKSQLNNIYRFIHTEFFKIEGVDSLYKLEIQLGADKLISDLYEKIYDRRQLNIENDSKLHDLYNEVKNVKLLMGRP